jgi:hypothetical protein
MSNEKEIPRPIVKEINNAWYEQLMKSVESAGKETSFSDRVKPIDAIEFKQQFMSRGI